MFVIVVLAAVICFIIFLTQIPKDTSSKPTPRKPQSTRTTVQTAESSPTAQAVIDLHDLPVDMDIEDREWLCQVGRYYGVRFITDDLMEAYRVHTMDQLFQAMPGWCEWDESIHTAEGQYDRMKRGALQNIDILSYDANWKKAKVIGTKGDLYTTSCKECDCPDFQFRNLPCKHMYALAMALDGDVSKDL